MECPRTRGSELRWRTGRTLPDAAHGREIVGIQFGPHRHIRSESTVCHESRATRGSENTFRSGSPTRCSMPSPTKWVSTSNSRRAGFSMCTSRRMAALTASTCGNRPRPINSSFSQPSCLLWARRLSKRPRSVQDGRPRNKNHRGPPPRSLSEHFQGRRPLPRRRANCGGDTTRHSRTDARERRSAQRAGPDRGLRGAAGAGGDSRTAQEFGGRGP